MTQRIETSRLVVRPFVASDAPAAAALWQAAFNAELTPATLTFASLAPLAMAALRQPPIGDRAVCLTTGELVGSVGLTVSVGPYDLLDAPPGVTEVPWTTEIGLFWALHPAHRGQGYATEAATALVQILRHHQPGVRRLIAHTEHGNPKSRAVMERLGLTIREFRDIPGAPWFQVIGQRPTASWSETDPSGPG
ncbi:MAG: GNAT family N-acetyltransferase [Myxococcota bacterium]